MKFWSMHMIKRIYIWSIFKSTVFKTFGYFMIISFFQIWHRCLKNMTVQQKQFMDFSACIIYSLAQNVYSNLQLFQFFFHTGYILFCRLYIRRYFLNIFVIFIWKSISIWKDMPHFHFLCNPSLNVCIYFLHLRIQLW